MTYQWGPGGPAVELEGVFSTQNPVLVARAVLLTLLAAAALMLAMSDLRFPSWMSPRLSRLPQGERTPHLLMGLFLLVLAVMDVVRASRQRVSRLLPGQPASLLPPATPSEGISPGAAALVGMLAEGLAVQALPRGEPAGGWQRLLVRLAPSIGAAPWAPYGQRHVRQCRHGAGGRFPVLTSFPDDGFGEPDAGSRGLGRCNQRHRGR